MRIHLASIHPLSSLMRQTPNGDGIWLGHEFIPSDPEKLAKWLVVFDEPPKDLVVRVPWNRRILFLTEPPEVKVYPTSFLNQFGIVVSPMRLSRFYRGTEINQQSALTWFYGLKTDQEDWNVRALNWRALASGPSKPKTELLSVICSNKKMTSQQVLRLKFIEHLQNRLGSLVHVYGRGHHKQIADKADAIAPYRYHLVLENNLVDHFWTEKLADSYLGAAFPFFSGCANIDSYFSPRAFSCIDIQNPSRAIDSIESALDANLYEKNIGSLEQARKSVMEVHNFFAVCHTLMQRFEQLNQHSLDYVDQDNVYSVNELRAAGKMRRARRQICQFVGMSR